VPALELAKQAALQLRTVALGVEYGDRKRSCGITFEYADESDWGSLVRRDTRDRADRPEYLRASDLKFIDSIYALEVPPRSSDMSVTPLGASVGMDRRAPFSELLGYPPR
jgi:hypothetical protein